MPLPAQPMRLKWRSWHPLPRRTEHNRHDHRSIRNQRRRRQEQRHGKSHAHDAAVYVPIGIGVEIQNLRQILPCQSKTLVSFLVSVYVIIAFHSSLFRNAMPKISLTDFVDVVSKSGSPKQTKVKQIKNRPAYQPATDFYKPFREGLISLHATGQDRSSLDNIVPKLSDLKKVANYPELIYGYKKWWGKKSIGWFDPPRGTYSSSGIDIAVNPELGLIIDGKRVVVKLYNKAEPITQFRIDMVPLLMELVLRNSCEPDDAVALLDVRKGKLHYLSVNPAVAKLGLDAELAYIAALWPHL